MTETDIGAVSGVLITIQSANYSDPASIMSAGISPVSSARSNLLPLEDKVKELELALSEANKRESHLIIENNLLRLHIELLSSQSDTFHETSDISESVELAPVEGGPAQLDEGSDQDESRLLRKTVVKRKLEEEDAAEFVLTSRMRKSATKTNGKKRVVDTDAQSCHSCGTTATPGMGELKFFKCKMHMHNALIKAGGAVQTGLIHCVTRVGFAMPVA